MVKLLLAVNSFKNPVNLRYNLEDATIEIILMLLGAFLFGFLLRHFLGFKKKEFIIEVDEDGNNKKAPATQKLGIAETDGKQLGDLSKQIEALKTEVERLSSIGLSTKSSQKSVAVVHSPAIDSVEKEKSEITEDKKEIKVEAKSESQKIITSTVQEKKEKDVPLVEKPANTKPDDLKVIEGIGPAIEKLLNENGIKTFEQLSKETVKSLEKLLDDAGPRFRVHVPETWPEQAKLLKEGKMEQFKALTELLKGGRRV